MKDHQERDSTENNDGGSHVDGDEATYRDVIALLSGDATLETRRRLARALYDPAHPLSYLARQSFRDQEFKEKWPPNEDDISPEIRELLKPELTNRKS